MTALDQAVRSGKALYVGLSNYGPEDTRRAAAILRELGTPCLIHQPRYSMLDRHIEQGLTDALREEKIGCICFMPLAGGKLTGKYLKGIPADSRAAKDPRFLKPSSITPEEMAKVAALNDVAAERGQSLAQLALSWVLRDSVVTSALIGASRPGQIIENVQAAQRTDFTADELQRIDTILAG